MPFVRQHARLTGGSLPEARRGRGRGSKKVSGGPHGGRRDAKKAKVDETEGAGGQRDARSLTEEKKAEITAALLDKWERERIGNRSRSPESERTGSGDRERGRARALPAAQPPAPVVSTFKPAGRFRLYRLRHRASFHCIRCQQQKSGSRVANMDGDWAQMVCEGCYGLLVHEQRKKVSKPTTARALPAQAPKQPSGKAQHKQPKRRPPETTAQRELRRLRRRLPWIGRLLAFFHAAGVRAEVFGSECLSINGSQFELSLITSAGPRLDNIIDEVALKYVRDKFVKAVEEYARFDEGLLLTLRWSERGFTIMRDEVPLGVIHPTHAQIPHREVIHANFLMPGPHWQQVAQIVEDAEPELISQWKHEQEAKAAAAAITAERVRTTSRRRIDQLPDDLDQELVDACLDASRRIRLDRQVAYDCPVVLEWDTGELTLLPITGSAGRLLIPFRFRRETAILEGELVLGDRDPLSLLIHESVTDADAITAWTWALRGFADATCIQIESSEQTTRREPTMRRWRSPRLESQRRPSTQTLPRKRPWPSHLEPIGHWIRSSSSFVVGHRRRLNDGKMASTEARDRARQAGIILHPHETWVQPHSRGVPDGIEMRFLWHQVLSK